MNAKILIDAERMRYPNTGLYNFCKYLGNEILNQNKSFDIELFMPGNETSNFRNLDNHVDRRFWHKFFMPFQNNYSLWHTTFQNTKFFPDSFKGKIAYTIHDLNFLHEKHSDSKRQSYLDAVANRIHRADRVITISNYVKNEVLEHIDVRPEKIEVIYNGCNLLNTGYVVTVPKNIPSKPFIYSIGNLCEKKNFHVLAGMLLNNDFELVISGINANNGYLEKILSYARSLGVENRIIFTGVVSDEEKHWYLANCLAFGFTSIAEGFGLPVIEAMYFGKPVFLSTRTSLPEIGGSLAYYFDNFDPQYMASQTERGLADFYTNPSKSIAVKEYVKKFSWNNAAEQYLELYKRLLD